MTDTAAHGDTRTTLVERLTHLRELMRWIDGAWHEKAAVARDYQPLVQQKGRWGVGTVALLSVGLVVAAFTVARPATDAVYDVLVGPFFSEEWADANETTAILVLLAIPVVVSIALAFLTVLARNTVVLPKQQARTQQENARREAHNAAVRAHELQIDEQLRHAGRDLDHRFGAEFFPEEYLYDEAVAFCIQVVRDHRADTVKEALNLFETDLYQRRMEDGQAQQLAELDRIRRQSATQAIIQAGLTGAVIGSVRAEGRATRKAVSRRR